MDSRAKPAPFVRAIEDANNEYRQLMDALKEKQERLARLFKEIEAKKYEITCLVKEKEKCIKSMVWFYDELPRFFSSLQTMVLNDVEQNSIESIDAQILREQNQLDNLEFDLKKLRWDKEIIDSDMKNTNSYIESLLFFDKRKTESDKVELKKLDDELALLDAEIQRIDKKSTSKGGKTLKANDADEFFSMDSSEETTNYREYSSDSSTESEGEVIDLRKRR